MSEPFFTAEDFKEFYIRGYDCAPGLCAIANAKVAPLLEHVDGLLEQNGMMQSQLNQAENENARLKTENAELHARWELVAKKETEAK